MRFLMFLLSSVLLAGCAGGAPVMFEKAGSQPGDFERAKYDCSVQMDQSSGAIAYRLDPLAHLDYLFQVRQDMANCLQRQGWTAQVHSATREGYREATPEEQTAAAKPLTLEEVWRIKAGVPKTP